jgi:hypothetical protein
MRVSVYIEDAFFLLAMPNGVAEHLQGICRVPLLVPLWISNTQNSHFSSLIRLLLSKEVAAEFDVYFIGMEARHYLITSLSFSMQSMYGLRQPQPSMVD